jgi:iron complex transport system substrate-binding protein
MSPRRAWIAAVIAAAVGLAAWRFAPKPPAAAPAGLPAQRVVALSPALVELVFAIGGGPRVVGVSDFTTWPPEAAGVPSVGSYINPNLEALAALRPDLVLLQGQHQKVRDYCLAHGQRYAALKLESLADVFAALSELGRQLGAESGARTVAAQLHAELDGVRRAVAGRPAVKTFVCLGRPEGPPNSLVTCRGGTFLDELLTAAGGANVFADAKEPYPTPALEVLTARAPEVILDLQPGRALDDAGRAKVAAEWQALPTLPAVRAGRVEVLTEDYLLVPGPRLGQTVRRLAAVLHPEAGRQP